MSYITAMEKTLLVGAVLFEGFELLDVFGPLEMFGLLEAKARLAMLAEQAGPVRSHQGPTALAEVALDGAPRLDVLLIPGGMGTRRLVDNPAFIERVKQAAGQATYVASVCTGGILLAQAGLLNGKQATTNKRVFKWVQSRWPQVHWVPEARWVETGNYFTASGVSAGMDMALGLIDRIFDRATSLEVANRAEYEWRADKSWDPFAKLHGLV
jgi:transcriptional regulator GlxA family with amidase domain